MNKVLVLGGAGFIGAHIVDSLVQQGYQVRVFDRGTPHKKHEYVEYFQADFNDVLLLSEVLEGVETVIHLISTSVPGTSNKDPISDINGNLVNTVRLLEMMRQTGGKRIIYFSSGGTVYGHPISLPMSETHPTNPICSYGIVKLAIEKYLNMYAELYGIDSCVLRPSNPFGAGQRHLGVQGFIGTCIYKALTGERLPIWGDGSVVRDYIHVADVASATLSALKNTAQGIYNISAGKGYSLNEIIRIVENVSGREVHVDYMDSRNFDINEMILDNQKARDELGWAPKVDIEAGITETAAEFERMKVQR